MIYLVNLSEKDFMRKKNKWLPKIKEYIDKNDPGATVIPFSGTFEQKLMDFETDDERKAYCEETKCTSILDKIVVQGYKALQLQYFFTAGEDEVTVAEKFQLLNALLQVKAWTIQRGSTAPQVIDIFYRMPIVIYKTMGLQAAGRIHTDFEKGFIMAEVMKFAAFKVGANMLTLVTAGVCVDDADVVSGADADYTYNCLRWC